MSGYCKYCGGQGFHEDHCERDLGVFEEWAKAHGCLTASAWKAWKEARKGIDMAFTECPMCGFDGAGSSEGRLNIQLAKMRSILSRLEEEAHHICCTHDDLNALNDLCTEARLLMHNDQGKGRE